MMDQLLMELATDITSRIVELYAPMDDLASLRATYSFINRVRGTTKVGRRIPLHRMLQRQGFWELHYYDDNYRAMLTTRLASVGNL